MGIASMRTQLELPDVEPVMRRGLYIDWISLTAHFERDDAVKPMFDAIEAAMQDHFGIRDSVPCDFNGNYAEGRRFKRAGVQVRWTKYTTCDLNGWHPEGRCAGTMNIIASGKSGIGMLALDRAMSFIYQLWNLGFKRASRLDVAMDVHDCSAVDPAVVYRHLVAGRWAVPRRRDFSMHAGFRQGEESLETPTVYVGNIKSDNYARIYDRAFVIQLDHPCTRFERQTRGKFAQALLESACSVSDASFESLDAQGMLGRWAASAIRTSCDFKDVSRLGTASPNWANRAEAPAVIDRIFGEVSPLEVGDVVVTGGFAASLRHAIRSSGRILALHSVHLMATKGTVANDLLALGGERLETLTEEDLHDLHLAHPELPLYKIRQAWEDCMKQWFVVVNGYEPQVRRLANLAVDKARCELGVE